MYYLNTEKTDVCDVLLTTTTHWQSGVIRLGTGSDISHASLLVDPHVLIDSTKEGVQSRNIHRIEYDDKCSIHLMRLKEFLSVEQKRLIVNFVRSKIAMRYNTFQAFVSGAVQHGLLKNGPKEERMFCSRLVAEAFVSAGIKLVENPVYCTPEDLLQSPLLEEIDDISLFVPNDNFISVNHGQRNFDQEMKDRTNHLLNTVRKICPKIETLNDIDWFLIQNQQYDADILKAFVESGYLSLENEIFEATQYLYNPDAFIAYFQRDSEKHCVDVSLKEDYSRHYINKNCYEQYVKQYHLKTFEALKNLYEIITEHVEARFECALEVLDILKPQDYVLGQVASLDQTSCSLKKWDGDLTQITLNSKLIKIIDEKNINKNSVIYAKLIDEGNGCFAFDDFIKLN